MTTVKNEKNRIDYLDSVKFFAIFLVIWGHCMYFLRPSVGLNEEHINVLSFIIKFNMPLFFFVSGLFIEGILKKSFWQVFLSKAKQLILPTFFFAGLYEITQNGSSGYDTFSNFLKNIIDRGDGMYWYCFDFFYAIILFYISRKLIKNKYIADIISILMVLFLKIPGYPKTNSLYLFLLAGSYLKDIILYKKVNIIYIILSILIFTIPLTIDLRANIYDFQIAYNWANKSILLEYIRYYFLISGMGLGTSILIIYGFRLLYIYRERGTFFAKWGKETLYLYLLNYFFIDAYKGILRHININMDKTIFTYLFTPALACIIIAVSLPIIKLIRRYNLLP